MPPFIPKRRLNSPPPSASAEPSPRKKPKLQSTRRAQPKKAAAPQKVKTFSLESDDSDSSLSEVDSDQFEDVDTLPKQSIPQRGKHVKEEADDDEDIEWEDAAAQEPEPEPQREPMAGGDLELVFRKGDEVIDYGTAAAAGSGKKGPTRREKEARVRTHQMHVQFLLWHNWIRNRWTSDQAVQRILVEQLPEQIKTEVSKWRKASGLRDVESEKKSKSSKKKRHSKHKSKHLRDERDWGRPSHRLEPGRADMSRGDPLNSLLKILSAYWKKRFAITAPGLRKRGYGTKQGLKQDIASFRNEEHDHEKHGERIRNIQDFREMARTCQGSRDAGAQLFTALLRGLGIESRLVASLQPSGFGWTKAEQMLPRKTGKSVADPYPSSDDSEEFEDVPKTQPKKAKSTQKRPSANKRQPARIVKGNKDAPIDLESEEDSKDADIVIKDDESVVDVTPSMPKQKPARYDRDVPFPIYWTEAVSPITSKVIPVSPHVLATPVAVSTEVLWTFEPRGAKAEQAKIVMAYVIAYSSDGTAKDVTVRYLRKRIWPGKTKAFRYPVEKVPIYDQRGKIKRYGEYDWFKHVMSNYARTDLMRTAVDDVEDADDLVPQEPEKKANEDDGDTLQSLKTSADFVLERHLRREEAVRPGAEPDRMFVSGKGDTLKEEPVYRRDDVERCLTAESWHKEGRKPIVGEQPMKLVPVRAVTLTRKREAEEHLRMTGEKQTQGLYSWDQTEFIIPPPIKDGIIPKNAYGNIDCFVPSMVPRGAVHVPLKGTVRICKRLEIDFAEAVTGFEFGNKRAVPVCTGVVIAKENEKILREAWEAYNEEQRKKEETKMEKLVLDLWRKFLMGLRIRERVEETYGEDLGSDAPALNTGRTRDDAIDVDGDETMTTNEAMKEDEDEDMGGGFLLPHEDDVPEQEDLVMEHHENVPVARAQGTKVDLSGNGTQYPTPGSSTSTPAKNIKSTSLLHDPDEHDISEPPSAEDSQDSGDNPSDSSDNEKLPPAMPASSLSKPRATTRQKTNVEVRTPQRQKRSIANSPSASSPSSDDMSNDERNDSSPTSLQSSSESEGVNESEEEEYVPVAKSKPRSTSKAKSTSSAPPKTSTPRKKAKSKSATSVTTTPQSKARTRTRTSVLPSDKSGVKTNRSRRLLRRDSTLVTSPYFDGEEDDE